MQSLLSFLWEGYAVAMSRARCLTCGLQDRVPVYAALHVQQCRAWKSSFTSGAVCHITSHCFTVAVSFLLGSTKAAMMPSNRIHLKVVFPTFMSLVGRISKTCPQGCTDVQSPVECLDHSICICTGQQAQDRSCLHQERHHVDCARCRQT